MRQADYRPRWADPDPSRLKPGEIELTLIGRTATEACDFGPRHEPWSCTGGGEFHHKGPPWGESFPGATTPEQRMDAWLGQEAQRDSDTVGCTGSAVVLAQPTWPAGGIAVFACDAHAEWLDEHAWVNNVDSGWLLVTDDHRLWMNERSWM